MSISSGEITDSQALTGNEEAAEDLALPTESAEIEFIQFNSFEEQESYRSYLSSLMGKKVCLSARVTHTKTPLEFIANLSHRFYELHSVDAVIISNAMGLVEFVTEGDSDEPQHHFTYSKFIVVESEYEE